MLDLVVDVCELPLCFCSPIEDSSAEELDNLEGAKYDPVGEPLSVIVARRCLEGLQAEVGGESPSEQGTEETRSDVEEDQRGEEAGNTEDTVGLGYARASLDGVERRVLGQLYLREVTCTARKSKLWNYGQRLREELRTHLLVNLRDVVVELVLGGHDCCWLIGGSS